MSRSALLVGLLALGVVGLPTSIAAATPDQLSLVSRGYDGRPGTGPWWISDSIASSISADGRRVAFLSSASNLWQGAPLPISVPNGAPLGVLELYVRDFAGPGVVPVSRGDGVDGPLAGDNQLSWGGGITPSGRSVLFPANLPETGNATGVFGYRRDLDEGATTIVVADDHGRPITMSYYGWPVPVGDRYVLFQTDQPVIDGLGAVPQGIYLRDLEVGRSVLVNRATGRTAHRCDVSLGGVSPGGRYVTFTSSSGALAAGPEASNPAGGGFLYLRDVRLGQTILLSRANGRNGPPIAARTLGGGQVRGDGCQVVFTATGIDIAEGSPRNGGLQVYLRDVCKGTTTLVSRANGDGPAAATVAPTDFLPPYDMGVIGFSADGRYVLFVTTARNVVDDVSSGELYLRDVLGKRTILVSRADGPNGAPSGGVSRAAAMTPDAKYVVFTTNSTALAPGIVNNICRSSGASSDRSRPRRSRLGPAARSTTRASVARPHRRARDPTTTTTAAETPRAAPATDAQARDGPGPGSRAVCRRRSCAGHHRRTRRRDRSHVRPCADPCRRHRDTHRGACLGRPARHRPGRRRPPERAPLADRAHAEGGRRQGRQRQREAPPPDHARYRLTIRALGASDTKSPAIVRTVDLRPRKAQRR